MNDPAIEKKLQSFRQNPEDSETFRSLEEHYFLANEWKQLVAIYAMRIQAIETKDPQEAARLCYRQGEFLEKRLAGLDKSLPAYEKAYYLSGSEEHFRTLIQVAEGLKNWDKLLRAYEHKLKLAGGAPEQSAILVQMAKCLAFNLKDLEQAKTLLWKAAKADEKCQSALEMLEKMYHGEDNWEALVELYYLVYQRESVRDKKIARLRQCATLCEEKLRQTSRAKEFYEKIFKLDPSNLPALNSLETLYAASEEWPKVVEAMEGQLTLLTEKPEKARLLMRIAIIWSEKIHDLNQATRCYERALEIQEDPKILKILEESYSYQGNWTGLAGVYQKRAKLAPNSLERKNFYLLLARLCEEKLQDQKAATQWYRSALQEAPQEIPILKDLQRLLKAQGACDELISTYRKELALTPGKSQKIDIYHEMAILLAEHERYGEAAELYEEVLSFYPKEIEILERLRDLYQEMDMPEKLLHVLTRRTELVEHGRRKECYREIADLLSGKLQREREAMDYYRKILDLAPRDLGVLHILKAYHAREQAYQPLIEIIRKIADVDPDSGLASHLEIARIQWEKLKDVPAAIGSYLEVLRIEPHYTDAWKALRALYKVQKQWVEYLDACRQILALIADVEEKIAVHWDVIDVYRQQRDPDKMAEYLKRLLQLRPDQEDALRQLSAIYREKNDWNALVEISIQEGRFCPEEMLPGKCREIGKLLQEKLGDSGRAISSYEKAHLLEPDHWETLEQLESLYRNTGNYEKLAQILQSKARLSEEGDKIASHLYEAGIVYEEQLGRPELALDSYRRALEHKCEHAEALARVEDICHKRQEMKQLATVYDELLELAIDKDLILSLCLKAARLGEDTLEDTSYAISHYLDILKLNPGHREALDSLIALYRLEQNWAQLADVYQKRIEITSDPEERKNFLYELATVYHENIGWEERACAVYHRLLEIDTRHLKAIVGLEKLYREHKRWPELVATLEQKAALVEQPERLSILLDLGELCRTQTLEFAQAIIFYRQALEIRKDDLDILSRLSELYRLTGNFPEQIETLEKRLHLDAPDRIALLCELAQIHEKLNQIDNAVDALKIVLKEDPKNRQAFEDLGNIYGRERRYQDLLELWEKQFYELHWENQKELSVRMAHLLSYELHDDERAQEVLLQTLEMDPDYAPARDALAALYEKHGTWEAIIALREEELQKIEDAPRKAALYAMLGRTWHYRIGDPEKALEMYLGSLDLMPDNLAVLKHVEDIYRSLSNWAELARTYEKELERDIDKARRISLFLQLAELEERLDRPLLAEEHYGAVLSGELDPENIWAIRGLERIYVATRQYEKLQKISLRELEVQKNPVRAVELYLELALLKEEKLGDVPGAREYFTKALGDRPQDLFVIRRLKALCKKEQDLPGYAVFLEKELALVTSLMETVSLESELIHVYYDLKQFEKAIAHGEELLKQDPDHKETMLALEQLYLESARPDKLAEIYLAEAKLTSGDKDRSIFLYSETGKIYHKLNQPEKAIECLQKVIEIQPYHQESVMLLIEILNQAEKWQELSDLYELATCFSDDRQREELHMKIAGLMKKLGNSEKAFLHYQIAYHLNASNAAAVQGVRRILEAREDWLQTLSALEIEARLVDEQKRAGLYFKMGELWQEKLSMPHQAIRCYLKVMEHAYHRQTSGRLIELMEKIENWQGLAEILEKDVRATHIKSEELPQKLLQLGQVYRKISKFDDAIRVYTGVLKLDNKHEQALTAMESLLQHQEQWNALVAILKQKLQNLLDAEKEASEEAKDGSKAAQFSLYSKIARIYQNELHQGIQAISCYEKALEIVPKSLEIIHILQELYEEWGDFQKLVSLYEAELVIVADHERVVRLYHLSGEVWEKRLFDPHQAIQTYQRLLVITPDVGAARALIALYRRCEYWERMPAVYKILIEDAQKQHDLAQEIALVKELGKIYQDRLTSTEKAIASFQRVLELELLDEEAFGSLEFLYERENRMADLAELLEEKVQIVGDAGPTIAIRLKLARLYEERLQKNEKAIDCLNKVLALDKGHGPALSALHRLYQKTENWESLVDVARKELEVAVEPDARAKLCFLLGNLLREHYEDQEQSHGYFLQATQALPSHVPSLLELSQIEIGRKSWEQAAKYMEQASEHIEKPDEKVTLLTSLGNLYLENLRQPEKSCAIYERALEIKPDAAEALTTLCEVYYQRQKWESLEPLLGRLIELKKGQEHLAHLHYRWGKTAEALEHADDAVGRYSAALRLLPQHVETLLALGEIYWNRDDFSECLEIYEQAHALGNLPDQSLILYRLGILSEKLKHYPKALAYYEEFLSVAKDVPPEVLHSLATLYNKRENYAKSLQYLDRIIGGDYGETEMYAALRQRAYVAVQMGEAERAIEIYERVFDYTKDNEIAKELVGLYMGVGDYEAAAEWNQTCYASLTNEAKRLENRLLHSRILWDGMKKSAEATAACKEALAIDPFSLKALKALTNIYLLEKNWQAAAQSYQSFLDGLPQGKQQVALPVYIALGKLYQDELHDIRGAIKHFENALTIDPEHTEAQIAVAELKSQIPEFKDEAIQGHRLLLRKDQFRVSSYLALYPLLRQAQQTDFATRVYRAIRVLSPEDAGSEIAEVPWEPKPPQSIPADGMQYLIPSRINAIREVMALTGEYQEKVYPPELEKKYGINRKEHLAAERVQKPVWYYTYKIMQTLGFKELYMYLNPKPTYEIFIENTNPPSLIISQALINQFSEQEMRFLLTRYLFYVWQKQTLAAKLNAEELKIYFYMLKSNFKPDEQKLTPDAEALQKKIHANLPWKLRKSLSTNAELWEQMAGTNIAHYLKCLEYSANRLGLLVCDSLELSVQMLYHINRLEKGKPLEKGKIPVEKLQKLDSVGDLMMYNISEQYARLRKVCGMAE